MTTRLPKKSGVKPFVVRLPEALQEELERIADRELRSVNAQMQVFLRKAIAEYDKQEHGEQVAV